VAPLVDLASFGLEALAPLLVIRIAVWRIDFRRGALAGSKAAKENTGEKKAESAAHGAG
jgi:hypothetical protein